MPHRLTTKAEKKFRLTPHQTLRLSTETRHSLHFPPPHSAPVDFADRMIIDTRDYNREHGSQTRKSAVMQTNA